MGRAPRVSASSAVDGSSEGHVQKLHHPQSLIQRICPHRPLWAPPSSCSVLSYFAAGIVLDWAAALRPLFCFDPRVGCKGASEAGNCMGSWN